MATPTGFTAAIVGDVHDLWSDDDNAALRFLNADIAVFVGDFGNEHVQLVQRIAQAPIPKAVILGNHDAWSWKQAAKDRELSPQDGVARQLEALGDCHVGFSSLAVPGKNATVVGGRPFAWGGSSFRHMDPLYSQIYDIRSKQQSAARITSCLTSSPAHHILLLVAHSGPTGLGDSADDICGRDFLPKISGGDFGDQDLRDAIDAAGSEGRVPALVAFGHMHHELCWGRGLRRRVVVDEATGTVHVNAAVVPRVRSMYEPRERGRGEEDEEVDGAEGEEGPSTPKHVVGRHFCVATIQDWGVEAVKDVWVAVDRETGGCHVVTEQVLVSTEGLTSGTVTRRVLDTSAKAAKEQQTIRLVNSPRIQLLRAAA